MSIVSRILVAGLVAAGLAAVQAAPTIARAQAVAPTGADDQGGSTGSRLGHASRCVMTFGLGPGCDKDAPRSRPASPSVDQKGADQKSADRPVLTKASAVTGGDDQGARTRDRLAHASKCVMTLGFAGGCDKDAPASAARADAAPDTGAKSQLLHASRCVISFGFVGDCDKK